MPLEDEEVPGFNEGSAEEMHPALEVWGRYHQPLPGACLALSTELQTPMSKEGRSSPHQNHPLSGYCSCVVVFQEGLHVLKMLCYFFCQLPPGLWIRRKSPLVSKYIHVHHFIAT